MGDKKERYRLIDDIEEVIKSNRKNRKLIYGLQWINQMSVAVFGFLLLVEGSKLEGKMKNVKLTPILVILLVLSFFVISCKSDDSDDCEEVKITSVDDTILAAFTNPVGFDNYVSQHSSDFDAQFYDCAQSRINEMTIISNERKDSCDGLYFQGDPFWTQCYEEVEHEVDNAIILLNEIISVTRGTKQFAQTSFGITLIFLKGSDPVFYNDFVSIINQFWDEVATNNTCKACRE